MYKLRKKIYVAAGYNTTYFGSGRKEFDPSKPMRPFEEYLKETSEGSYQQLPNKGIIEEGFIGSFMSGRFLKQANLPGFLPFMIPELLYKPCTGIEGACGTGGRTIATGLRSILAETADVVFVCGFEMQNTVKAVYGADVLAGAGHYSKERKAGDAHFFPGLFAKRAGAYYQKYGYELARQGMARWYEQCILNARKNPKAQEFHNQSPDLFALGMTKPKPEIFVPYLNPYDCSKVTDGASSLILLSEEGLLKSGLKRSEVVEIVGIGEAEGDITIPPEDETTLSTTVVAVQKAFESAGIGKEDLGLLEIHDCFTINALLAFEAIGFATPGKGAQFIIEGQSLPTGSIPTNLSGGLGGFGHPTGASGVRQMVDLLHQLTGKAANQIDIKKNVGMMISMGGNDKTVTALIVKV